MLTTFLRHLRSQAIAYAALFVALGGTGYAAVNLPAHSVGARQLRRGAVGNAQLQNHSVSPIKLAHGSIAGYMRAYAQISPSGVLVASRPAAHLLGWNTAGPAPGGLIVWSQPIPAACFALATTTAPSGPPASYASAELSGGPHSSTSVLLSAAQSPTSGVGAVNVAVMCPQP